MSVPNSTIYLCSGVPLDNRYIHTMWWSDRNAQINGFFNKSVKRLDRYTFLRKSQSLKVEASYDEAQLWNYLYWQNPGARWPEYYFINDIRYVDDTTVELFIELDVMQTYAFNYSLMPCMVEREHTADDTIGSNTQPEGLECGPLIVANSEDVEKLKEQQLMVLSTIDIQSTADNGVAVGGVLGQNYWGVFSGLKLYCVDKANFTAFKNLLLKVENAGASDGIVTMWMYPKALVNSSGGVLGSVNTTEWPLYEPKWFTDLNLFEGYKPRNNKLYTFPFNFLQATNNQGCTAEYHYERFWSNNPEAKRYFIISGGLSPNATVLIYPQGYKGDDLLDEGLSIGEFPTCAWASDPYKIWLAQNSNSLTVQKELNYYREDHAYTAALLGVASNTASLSVGGIIDSAVTNIHNRTEAQYATKQLLAQKRDMDMQPHQARGSNTAPITVYMGKHTFTFYNKCITAEYARRIDSFFDMYGYQTNLIKHPNTHVRKNWTYTKTVGCQINGSFAKSDMVRIESIFDNGITFWTDFKNVGNYDLENEVI